MEEGMKEGGWKDGKGGVSQGRAQEQAQERDKVQRVGEHQGPSPPLSPPNTGLSSSLPHPSFPKVRSERGGPLRAARGPCAERQSVPRHRAPWSLSW
jgi:hypothetical protein